MVATVAAVCGWSRSGQTQLIHENAADDDQHQENRRVQFMMLGAAETEEIEVRVE